MKRSLIFLALLTVVFIAAIPPAALHQGEGLVYWMADRPHQIYYYYWSGVACIVWHETYLAGYGWQQVDEMTIGTGTARAETDEIPRLGCYNNGWVIITSNDPGKALGPDPSLPWILLPVVVGGGAMISDTDTGVYIAVHTRSLEQALVVWNKFYDNPPETTYVGEDGDMWYLGPMPEGIEQEATNG